MRLLPAGLCFGCSYDLSGRKLYLWLLWATAALPRTWRRGLLVEHLLDSSSRVDLSPCFNI